LSKPKAEKAENVMSQNDTEIVKTRIDLKMTPEQKQLLQPAAKASNMSLSAFVLNSASKAAKLLLESQPATTATRKVCNLRMFTKPARERWEVIPVTLRQRLLSNALCGNCRQETTIALASF
jgi:uncharacterized protein (DUF1778 family)